MIAVQLVMFSAFDMETFLPLARQALGHGLSSKADEHAVTTELHNMMCVANLMNGGPADIINLYNVAYLIAADERDMSGIIQIAGMPHVCVDSITRGVKVAIISGPLSEWQGAIRRGCSEGCELEVRKVYNKVYNDLIRRGLDGILGVADREPQGDSTFLLEFKS